jgi:hypothetical protein
VKVEIVRLKLNNRAWPTTLKVESVAEFVSNVSLITRLSDFRYAFRGHGDKRWDFMASVFRESEGLWHKEKDIHLAALCRTPSEFISDKTTYDRMVRLQHFSLPTRLLDVTSNALVALYFSVSNNAHDSVDGDVLVLQIPEKRSKTFQSDTVAIVANLTLLSYVEQQSIFRNTGLDIEEFNKIEAVRKLVEFVQSEKPYFTARINPADLQEKWFVSSKRDNPRVTAQLGDMIIFGSFGKQTKTTLTDAAKANPINVNRIIVPSTAKKQIREELAHLGFSDETMFPGLETATKEIKRIFRHVKSAF